MALHTLHSPSVNDDLFDKAAAERPLSKFRIPDHEADPKVMYRLIKDELMLDGNSRQNLATFCQTYAEDEVHRLMDDCLDKNIPACIKYTRPEGGLFIWCTLPDEVDAAEFVKKALEKKVAVVPGATFNPDQNAPSQSFRLNYSTPSDEAIVKGVEALGDVAREMIK